MSTSGHSQKAAGYAFSLNLVRSLGLWSASTPFPKDVQKPQYLPLVPLHQAVDWDELLRKYLKHNSGQDARITAQITRLELAIWRALNKHSSLKHHVLHKRRRARPGKAAQAITEDHGDVHVGSSGKPKVPQEWLLTQGDHQQELRELLTSLESTLPKLQGTQSSSATAVVALAQYSLSNFEECYTSLTKGDTTTPSFVSQPQSNSHDLDLQVLGIVLYGMTLEHRIHRDEFAAVNAYKQLPVSPPPPIPEAQRYLEVGLARLALLESGTSSLSAHRSYISLTSSFTAVSPHRRLDIITSYLTSLLSQLTLQASLPSSATNISDQSLDTEVDTSDLLSTMQSYERLLRSQPSLAAFPRAGVPTPNMYQFMEFVYSFWALGQIPAPFAVDALYRALNRTYASQQLHRYLFFILANSSYMATDRDKGRALAEDALRNLRLYIALFEKSRETDQVDIQRQLRKYREGTEGVEVNDSESDPVASEDDSVEDSHEAGIESNEDFYAVCSSGARLLLSEAGMDNKQEQGDDRINLVSEAMKTIEKAYHLLPVLKDSDLEGLSEDERFSRAEVLLWYGVTKTEWALTEADPEQSRKRAKQGLSALSTGSSLLSANTPGTGRSSILRKKILYSLAYAQLELRDVGSATASAKDLVQTSQMSGWAREISDIRLWHLLVLALTAKKDWSKAKEVAELALFGEDSDNVLDNEERDTTVGQATTLNDIATEADSHMYIVTPASAPYDPTTQGIDNKNRSADHISLTDNSASSYVKIDLKGVSPDQLKDGEVVSEVTGYTINRSDPVDSKTPLPFTEKTTTAWDDLDCEVELWITRNKCIEAVEGPEIALQDLQQNVFTYFSKRQREIENQERQTLPSNVSDGPSNYPYASKEMQNKPSLYTKLGEQPLLPSSVSTHTTGRARSILGSISLRHRSRSQTNASHQTTPMPQISGSLDNHLAIPTDSQRPISREASIRSNITAESVRYHPNANTVHTTRSQSARGSFEDLPSAPAATGAQKTHPQAAKILSKLWLTSAASFRRWGRLDECRGAINEAEDLTGDVDPDVWFQYALYLLSNKDPEDSEKALLSMTKALAIQTDHVPTTLLAGKVRLDSGDFAISEGFLDVATQTNAWDSPEAWYLLAKVYEKTGRPERARECLVYALSLEETRPLRDLRSTLRRYL